MQLSRWGGGFLVLPTPCHLPRIPSPKACFDHQLDCQWLSEPFLPYPVATAHSLCGNSLSPGFYGTILLQFYSNPVTFGSSLSLDPPYTRHPGRSVLPTLSLGDFIAFLCSWSSPRMATTVLPCLHMHAAPHTKRWVSVLNPSALDVYFSCRSVSLALSLGHVSVSLGSSRLLSEEKFLNSRLT